MYDNQSQAAYAYIAGLIDGEGAFMISRSTSGKGRKTPSYTPRIKVGMTTKPSVDFIVKHTGIGKYSYEPTRKSRPTRKGYWIWQIHSLEQVIKFLDLIEPYLVLKKPQAAHLRMYCERFTRQRKCMDGVPKNEKVFREEAYHEMRKLNGRLAGATTNPSNIREDEVIV